MPARRTRWPLVLATLAVVLGVGGYAAYTQRARLFNLLETERADAGALAELADAKLPAAASVGADWPQWRGPNRDGRAAGPLNTDWTARPPKVLWSVPGGGGYAALAVAGGRVYAFDFDPAAKAERLRCLAADTGAELWALADPVDYAALKSGYAGGPRAAPTVHDGRAYTVGAMGQFRCVAVGEKPTLLWEHDLAAEFRADVPQWGFASAPLIEGELVIVQPGGRDGTVAAFDRLTGEKRWAVGRNPNGYSSPAAATLGGVRQIVAVTGDSVLGLSPDGTRLWDNPWTTPYNANIASPVIAGDYVFVSSNYDKGCVLLKVAAGGNAVTEVYFRKKRVLSAHMCTPVERDGFVYGFDGHNMSATLKCVNLRTGEVVDGWEALDDKARPIRHGTVVLHGDKLLGLTEAGTLFLADADPKEFRFRGHLPKALPSSNQCWAAPAVADGRAYLRDAEAVVCVDLR